MLIGVLALQGAFKEHITMLKKCGAQAVEVRTVSELDRINALIIPGGESTAIGRLLEQTGLMQAIVSRGQVGMPIYGTCAGMILLCNDIVDSDQPRLGLFDATVRRNAFGRQKESFETTCIVDVLGQTPIHATFIRAPWLEKVGLGVTILAQIENKIVIAQQENILVSAFHSELTEDTRLHQYFLQLVSQS